MQYTLQAKVSSPPGLQYTLQAQLSSPPGNRVSNLEDTNFMLILLKQNYILEQITLPTGLDITVLKLCNFEFIYLSKCKQTNKSSWPSKGGLLKRQQNVPGKIAYHSSLSL